MSKVNSDFTSTSKKRVFFPLIITTISCTCYVLLFTGSFSYNLSQILQLNNVIITTVQMRRRGLQMAEKFVHISPGFPSHSCWFSFYNSPQLRRASRKWQDGFRRKAPIAPCHFISWEAELGRRLFYGDHSWEGAGMRGKVKERRHGCRAPEKAAWGFATPTYKFG